MDPLQESDPSTPVGVVRLESLSPGPVSGEGERANAWDSAQLSISVPVPEIPDAQRAFADAQDQSALNILPWASGGGTLVTVPFIAKFVFGLTEGVTSLQSLLADVLVTLLCLLIFSASLRNRVPPARAPFLLLCIALAFQLDLVGSTFATQSMADFLLLPFLSVAVGALAMSLRWYLAAVVPGTLAGIAALLVFANAEIMAVDASILVAGTVLSAILYFGRSRALERLVALHRDADQQRREALVQAENARRELRQRLQVEREKAAAERGLRQLQKLESLGTLAGGVAHDMNNVLGVVTSLASTAQEEVPRQSELHATLTDILMAARRGASLTRNLLGFARKGKHRVEVVSLGRVANEVCSMLRRTLPKSVVIETVVEGRAVVEGDPDQLSHALLNLCLNAAEAMPRGGALRVTARDAQLLPGEASVMGVAPGKFVELVVADQGSGIPAALRNRVFEPFFTTRADQGRSGLGLSMVYGTVRAHSGGVSIVSREGAGTSISCWLPASQKEPVAAPTLLPVPAPGQPRVVLVVDDEPLVRKAALRTLRSLGYEALVAQSGAEAVAMVRAHPSEISVALLDLAMPEMDGTETFERIHALDPGIAVVIASGFPRDQNVDDLLAKGVRAFLPKPYDRQGLGEVLDRLATGSTLRPPGE